jgi:hypothetical protein
MFEQCFARDTPELLRQIATSAQALTGGHDDGCDTRHLLLPNACLPLARSWRCGNAVAVRAGF